MNVNCINHDKTLNDNAALGYGIVVHGIDADTFERLAIRFNSRRGGMRPTDLSRYMNFQVTEDSLEGALCWIKNELLDCYRELYFFVSVTPSLTWSELVISPETTSLLGRYGATAKILFMPGQSDQHQENQGTLRG